MCLCMYVCIHHIFLANKQKNHIHIQPACTLLPLVVNVFPNQVRFFQICSLIWKVTLVYIQFNKALLGFLQWCLLGCSDCHLLAGTQHGVTSQPKARVVNTQLNIALALRLSSTYVYHVSCTMYLYHGTMYLYHKPCTCTMYLYHVPCTCTMYLPPCTNI